MVVLVNYIGYDWKTLYTDDLRFNENTAIKDNGLFGFLYGEFMSSKLTAPEGYSVFDVQHIMDKYKIQANDTQLPQISVKPYARYVTILATLI